MINPERILKKLTFKLLNPLINKSPNKLTKKDWKSFRRVLVFRLDNKLGNAILMLPLIQSIKRSLPEIRIDVLYSSSYTEIFEMHPDIDSIIEYNQQFLLKNPARYIGFLKNIRKKKYDVVFSSTNSNSFSISQAVFASLLKSEFTIGFDWKQSSEIYSAVVKGNTETHYSQAQVDLWRYFDEDAKSENPKIYFVPDTKNEFKEKEILLWFGATGNKILSQKLMQEILHFLNEDKFCYQLAAGPHDEHLLAKYSEIKNQDIRFLKGSLKDTAKFFKNYKIVFIPDTGPMHLSVALGIPTVQMFVNSDPVWYAYKGDNIFLINKKLDAKKLLGFVKNQLK